MTNGGYTPNPNDAMPPQGQVNPPPQQYFGGGMPPQGPYMPSQQPPQGPYQPPPHLWLGPAQTPQPQGQPAFQPRQPSPKKNTGPWVGLIIFVVSIVMLGIGGAVGYVIGVGHKVIETVSGPTVTATPARPTPTGPAPTTGIKDGIYLVGIDIAPGTYKSDGVIYNELCLGETRNEKGLVREIFAGIYGGIATIHVLSTDYIFSSTGCGSWTKVA